MPYEYVMSSTLTNNPDVDYPQMNTLHYAPSNDQVHGDSPPTPLGGPVEHAHTDQEKNYDRNGKLLVDHHTDNILPNPTSASHQTNRSQTGEKLLPSATTDTTVEPYTSQPSVTESDEPSAPETTLRPPDDYYYRLSDESSTINVLLSSPSVTKKPYSSSSPEDPGTTTEIETVTAYVDSEEQEKSSEVEGHDRPDEPQEPVDTTMTTDFMETSTEEKPSKTNTSTEKPDATSHSASTTKYAYVTTAASIETTERQYSRESPVQARSVYPTTEPASVNYEQSGAISLSTTPSSRPTSTSISKTTNTASILPNNEPLSLLVSREFSTPRSISVESSGENNENTPTVLKDTTLTSTLQPLNGDIIDTTTELIEVGSTQWIAINGQNNAENVDQDTSILAHTETTNQNSKSLYKHASMVTNPEQNNLPSSTTPSKSLVNRPQTTAGKLDMYTNVKTDYYPRPVVKETGSSLKLIGTPTKPSTNAVQRKPTFSTAPDDSTYRTSANNRDRYASKTSLTPQSLKDSDIWYNHLYAQTPPKKELNDEQIDFLLKKLIKLLKPEIEKQSITKDSISRFVTPKHADQEKLVYIILPWIRDTSKNVGNEEQMEGITSPLKTFDKT